MKPLKKTMMKKTLIDALTIGDKEERLAITYMRAHHKEWVDLAYKDFYLLDNGDNRWCYEHVQRTFVDHLIIDMGFSDYDAVITVVDYFNKEKNGIVC